MPDSERQVPLFPLPVVDDDSQRFWAACAERRLDLQQCDRCARYVYYPRIMCPHCSSSRLTWRTVTGRGTVYTYTVARRAPTAAFADLVPYVVALVDLEEGVRMMANVIADPDQVSIGASVGVVFVERGGMLLPAFALEEKIHE